jgi:hypothetical protein
MGFVSELPEPIRRPYGSRPALDENAGCGFQALVSGIDVPARQPHQ